MIVCFVIDLNLNSYVLFYILLIFFGVVVAEEEEEEVTVVVGTGVETILIGMVGVRALIGMAMVVSVPVRTEDCPISMYYET